MFERLRQVLNEDEISHYQKLSQLRAGAALEQILDGLRALGVDIHGEAISLTQRQRDQIMSIMGRTESGVIPESHEYLEALFKHSLWLIRNHPTRLFRSPRGKSLPLVQKIDPRRFRRSLLGG